MKNRLVHKVGTCLLRRRSMATGVLAEIGAGCDPVHRDPDHIHGFRLETPFGEKLARVCMPCGHESAMPIIICRHF